MIKREITITNKTGLHARPASMFVQTAGKFKSSVTIEKEDKTINAKSIISVLSGGIGQGTKITLVIDGEDEQEAEKALVELIESNFGE
ncbi:MAG TPA: HPr family phosphocarrier protein [Peptococcaceae bacterium]|jgi:phosphocarrier protein HPr|nr:HPr family phosphocarrier protein [Clostridia bacterium]HOB81398.1 HPr family phosphocarrier protein [Peptococcaceae bacterium]HPZ71623.1 HPr family phosphocarrier protein [Peptococcaceae bacterium]HQD53449.1 HPr family phosphocarrier protein [Peptococcaceae bacterium]